MSTLLSTQAMVAECQRRVPIQLTNAFWMRKLNEAYRSVSQKGAYVWDERSISFTLLSGAVSFDPPATFDPGKPMHLAGPTSGTGAYAGIGVNTLIPKISWEDAMLQQYSEMPVIAGMFSAWALTTVISGGGYAYKGYLFPSTSLPTGGNLQFTFSYHIDVASVELVESAVVFFPTPNIFDGLFIDLAEAEVKRIYGLAGWEIVQKKAEAAIMPILDVYRSQKNAPAGLLDQQKQTNETKLMAQERS